MRAHLVMFTILAGAVAGCASTPPPPPPIAAIEPAPAPAPAPLPPSGPLVGTYRGTASKTAESGPRCRAVPAAATVRVARNNTFTLGGMRGRVNPDGSVASVGRGPSTMSGMVSGGTMNVTTMRAGCGYSYTLNRA